MSWNHRVVKSEPDEQGYTYCSIRNVFYDEDGEIFGWSAEAVDPFGSNLEELKADFDRMAKAFNLPVLDEAKLAARLENNSPPSN